MPLWSDNLSPKSTTLKRFIIIIFIIGLQQLQQINANGIKAVPLTTANVYRLLHDTFNRDAVPEGRVVTQGIAAAAGFTLGLKKALAGVFLYDIITANITEDVQDVPQSPAQSQAQSQKLYLTREICFETRSARSYEDADAIAEAYSRLEKNGNKLKPDIRKSDQKRRSKPKRKPLKKKSQYLQRPQRLEAAKANQEELSSFATNPLATDSAKDYAVLPFTTQDDNKVAAAAADSKLNGLDSTLSTTTSTDNDQPVTCVILQKPKE